MECGILSMMDEKEVPKFDVDLHCLEYAAVTSIRLLHIRQYNLSLWSRIDSLMDHVIDMDEAEARLWKASTVDLIRKRCKQQDSESAIMRTVGILCTNGVNQGLLAGHALYPTFSYISHSCMNNSRFQIHQDRRIVLRAQKDICKGDEVTTLYLPSLINNCLRRKRIRNNWKFDCKCQRCCDKTELGTFADALVCQKCAALAKEAKAQDKVAGFLLPDDPLEYDGVWRCNMCDKTVDGLTVYALVRELQRQVESTVDHDPTSVERTLADYGRVLHPNHCVILVLKRRLLDLYRLRLADERTVTDDSLQQPDEDLDELRTRLERQVQLGQEVLNVVQVLEPGLSLCRGRVLRNMHKPRLRLAKLDLAQKRISMAQFVKISRDVIRDMKEAVRCLEDFDPVFVASSEAFQQCPGNSMGGFQYVK